MFFVFVVSFFAPVVCSCFHFFRPFAPSFLRFSVTSFVGPFLPAFLRDTIPSFRTFCIPSTLRYFLLSCFVASFLPLSLSFILPVVRSFVRSLACSLVRSFVCSFGSHVFPDLAPVTCICFEVSWTHCVCIFVTIGQWDYFGFVLFCFCFCFVFLTQWQTPLLWHLETTIFHLSVSSHVDHAPGPMESSS